MKKWRHFPQLLLDQYFGTPTQRSVLASIPPGWTSQSTNLFLFLPLWLFPLRVFFKHYITYGLWFGWEVKDLVNNISLGGAHVEVAIKASVDRDRTVRIHSKGNFEPRIIGSR